MAPSRSLLVVAIAAGVASSASVHPPCRKSAEFHLLKWPQGDNQLIVFGGKGYDWKETKKGKLKKKVQFFGDTFAFDPSSRGWSQPDAGASAANHPMKRWKPASTSFHNNTAIAMFGGCKSTEADGVLDDLWVLKPTTLGNAEWFQMYTSNPPAPRRGHIVASNSTHLIVIGGKAWNKKKQKVEIRNDLWALPLSLIEDPTSAGPSPMNLDAVLQKKKHTPGQWTEGNPFPGHVRWGATGRVVTGADGREYLAFFGGRNYNHDPDREGKYIYYNDLWLYDLQADTWTVGHPGGVGDDIPIARDHHGAASINGDLYVFGGRIIDTRDPSAVLNDLWTFSCATMSWRLVQAGGPDAPSPRFMPGVATALWSGNEVISVFGGESFPGSTKQSSLNDLWMYTPDVASGSNSWKWYNLFEADCSASSVEVIAGQSQLSEVAQSWVAGGAVLSMLAAFTAAFGGTLLRRSDGREVGEEEYQKLQT
jgi:N-acetylneuraminic acid mutarotase